MIVYGVDKDGLVIPLRVNSSGQVIIAGMSALGNSYAIRVDESGQIVLSGDVSMGFFQLSTQHGTAISPADSLVYYVGNNFAAPSVTPQLAGVYVLKACTLRHAILDVKVTSTLGSAQASTFALRVGDAVDYPVFSSVLCTAAQQIYISADLGISFLANTFFEWKWTCPVWVTNPLLVTINSYLLFEYT